MGHEKAVIWHGCKLLSVVPRRVTGGKGALREPSTGKVGRMDKTTERFRFECLSLCLCSVPSRSLEKRLVGMRDTLVAKAKGADDEEGERRENTQEGKAKRCSMAE